MGLASIPVCASPSLTRVLFNVSSMEGTWAVERAGIHGRRTRPDPAIARARRRAFGAAFAMRFSVRDSCPNLAGMSSPHCHGQQFDAERTFALKRESLATCATSRDARRAAQVRPRWPGPWGQIHTKRCDLAREEEATREGGACEQQRRQRQRSHALTRRSWGRSRGRIPGARGGAPLALRAE